MPHLYQRLLLRLRRHDFNPVGFTLLEGIVIVGILIVLAAIAIPNYNALIPRFGQINRNFANSASSATQSANNALQDAR